LPGADWARSILKRHNNLVSQRVATNISKCRAEVSPGIISEYFDNLSKVLQNIPAENIYNYDESNLQDNPGKQKMIFQRGTKYHERVQNHSKSSTLIMVYGSAAGVLLPPYIIFKSSEIWQPWTEGRPKGKPCCSEPCCLKGSRYNRTTHGWIDAVTFKDWFTTSFLPHAKRQPGRKVLIGDNLSSHIQPDIIFECEKNDIDFVRLPKNSTYLTQPLDVGFFRPLKQAWRNSLNEWKNQNTTLKAIPKSSFPSLVRKTLDCMDSCNGGGSIKVDLQASFKAIGICPLNKYKVLDKLPNENNSAIINDTITDYLKGQRYLNLDENSRKKRKKLSVPPGRSITSAVLGLNNLSSDEDTEINYPPLTDDNLDSDHEAPIDETVPEYQTPTETNLQIGSFVLVKIKFGKRVMSTYIYFAVIKSIVGSIITVTGLKSMDTSKQTFKIVKSDVFDVSIKNIEAILKCPMIEGVGDNIRYTFSHSVDVREA